MEIAQVETQNFEYDVGIQNLNIYLMRQDSNNKPNSDVFLLSVRYFDGSDSLQLDLQNKDQLIHKSRFVTRSFSIYRSRAQL